MLFARFSHDVFMPLYVRLLVLCVRACVGEWEGHVVLCVRACVGEWEGHVVLCVRACVGEWEGHVVDAEMCLMQTWSDMHLTGRCLKVVNASLVFSGVDIVTRQWVVSW